MSSVTPNTNTELETYKVEPLKGSANYRTWKFSMRMVLQARDLWEVVSGEEVKPEAEAAAQAWEKKARKALATIALALTAAEKEHIIECTTPKAAWDILEKLYEGNRTAVTEGLAAMGRCHEMAEPVGAVTGCLAAKARCNGRLQRGGSSGHA